MHNSSLEFIVADARLESHKANVRIRNPFAKHLIEKWNDPEHGSLSVVQKMCEEYLSAPLTRDFVPFNAHEREMQGAVIPNVLDDGAQLFREKQARDFMSTGSLPVQDPWSYPWVVEMYQVTRALAEAVVAQAEIDNIPPEVLVHEAALVYDFRRAARRE